MRNLNNNRIRPSCHVAKSSYLEAPVSLYAHVDIGADCKIGRFTYIRPYSYTGKSVSIGRFCSIGDYCVIGASKHPTNWLTTHTFAYDNKTKFEGTDLYENIEPQKFPFKGEMTSIGSDVWIGSKSIIMTGVSIGHGAVVGAGAVITKNVPPYAIVVGNNKVIRYRFPENIIKELLALAWWDLDIEDISRIRTFDDIEEAILEIKKIRYARVS